MTSTRLIELAFAGVVPDLLLEDRLSFLANKFRDVSTTHDTLAKHKTSAAIVNHFASKADPTPNKQYTDHLMRWYAKGNIRQEDHALMHSLLSGFHQEKQRLPQADRDLGQYDHPSQVRYALGRLKPTDKTKWGSSSADHEDVAAGSTKVHDDPEMTIRRVDKHSAMEVLGSGTHWCVVPDKHTFDQYKHEGPLHHIHIKSTDKRYLFHSESSQFADENDNMLDSDQMHRKYPKLLHALPGFAKHLAREGSGSTVDRIVNDPELMKEREIPRYAAANPNTSLDAMEKLVDHPDHRVQYALTKRGAWHNTYRKQVIYQKLIDKHYDNESHGYAVHKGIADDRDIYNWGSTDRHNTIVGSLIAKANAHPAKAVSYTDILGEVARNVRDKDHIRDLLHHPNPHVVYAALYNSHADREDLDPFLRHPDVMIKNAARQRFGFDPLPITAKMILGKPRPA